MPTQKTFKRRVRARSAKTHESYTAARAQLIRRAGADAAGAPATPQPDAVADRPAEPVEMPVSEDAILAGTGRRWADWFSLLDAWGGKQRRHPEIARWLREQHGVDGWWAQSVTVGYERARGLRAKGQMATGFTITVNRTVNVPGDRARLAFTDAVERRRWLPGVTIRQRPTKAATSARFDWPDPPSIVVAYFTAKDDGRVMVSVGHERLPDAAAADRMKTYWRERLVKLKEHLEAG